MDSPGNERQYFNGSPELALTANFNFTNGTIEPMIEFYENGEEHKSTRTGTEG